MLEQSSFSFPAPEEWRPIVGYEGLYEVSDQGRVRSWRGPGARSRRGPRAEPYVLRARGGPTGYRMVQLTGGVARWIHRLVLSAFVGPCPPGHEGSHLNGNRADNRLVNLAWKTPRENAQDKIEHGTHVTGEQHGQAKLTVEAVRAIRVALTCGETQTAIAARYGVTRRVISQIREGRAWRHV